MLDTITNIQPKESGGGSGATRESIVYSMAEDMLDKLPPDYIPHEVGLASNAENHKTLVMSFERASLPASGQSQSEEDGGSQPHEHLPTPGGGPHAEDYRCGAHHSSGSQAGHRGHHHHERGWSITLGYLCFSGLSPLQMRWPYCTSARDYKSRQMKGKETRRTGHYFIPIFLIALFVISLITTNQLLNSILFSDDAYNSKHSNHLFLLK